MDGYKASDRHTPDTLVRGLASTLVHLRCETQTPLNAVRGYAQLLRDGWATEVVVTTCGAGLGLVCTWGVHALRGGFGVHRRRWQGSPTRARLACILPRKRLG